MEGTHRTYLNSGAYGSILITAKTDDAENVFERMDDENLWEEDVVQLGARSIYYNLGTDAFGQPVTYYLAAKDARPAAADQTFEARLTSGGETICLLSLIDSFSEDRPEKIHLPAGEYKVRFLRWNLVKARDDFSGIIDPHRDNIRHEIIFVPVAA